MNKCDKIQEAQTHLNNRERYKPRKNGMAIETLQRVDELVSRLDQNNYIDDTTKKWFSQTRNPPRIPIFYTLTKLHKPNPVGRPIIISGCEGPTERLSSFVDKLLQPIAQTQKSYLKDTTHVINFMEKTTTILVSMDVTSLYTNIPQEEECRFLSRVEGRISRVESRGSRVQVIFKKLISYVLSYIKLICNANSAVRLFSTFSPYACYESVCSHFFSFFFVSNLMGKIMEKRVTRLGYDVSFSPPGTAISSMPRRQRLWELKPRA